MEEIREKVHDGSDGDFHNDINYVAMVSQYFAMAMTVEGSRLLLVTWADGDSFNKLFPPRRRPNGQWDICRLQQFVYGALQTRIHNVRKKKVNSLVSTTRRTQSFLHTQNQWNVETRKHFFN